MYSLYGTLRPTVTLKFLLYFSPKLLCHAKIGLARPILAKKPSKSGPWTTFATNIGPAGPIIDAYRPPNRDTLYAQNLWNASYQ